MNKEDRKEKSYLERKAREQERDLKRRKARSNRLRVVYTWLGEQEIPQDERWNYCNKVLGCGHECDGIRDEPECLPCLHPDCGAETAAE